MEIFTRIKTILIKPKDEWDIIEAENKPHAKIFGTYLLIIALIPAAAIFFNYWWQWHTEIEKISELIRKSAIDNSMDAESLTETLAVIKIVYPFNVLLGVVKSVRILLLILGGSYIAAAVINMFSEQFGLQKNFNRSFSLVAYSYTPLCIAGVFYAYPPLVQLVPYVGLYGLYLLYIGIKPLLNPPAEKLTGCFIMALIVTLVTYVIIPKIEKPITDEISKNILIEQFKNTEYKGEKLCSDKDIEFYKELKFDEIEREYRKEFNKIKKSIKEKIISQKTITDGINK